MDYWIVWNYIKSWFVSTKMEEEMYDAYIYDDWVELLEIEPFLPK
jgi:hypothetical protein